MRFHLEQLSVCCVEERTQESPTLFAGQFATFLMFILIWHLMDRRIVFLFQEFIQGYDYNSQGASNVCQIQQKL